MSSALWLSTAVVSWLWLNLRSDDRKKNFHFSSPVQSHERKRLHYRSAGPISQVWTRHPNKWSCKLAQPSSYVHSTIFGSLRAQLTLTVRGISGVTPLHSRSLPCNAVKRKFHGWHQRHWIGIWGPNSSSTADGSSVQWNWFTLVSLWISENCTSLQLHEAAFGKLSAPPAGSSWCQVTHYAIIRQHRKLI